jgi:hypothetical protein
MGEIGRSAGYGGGHPRYFFEYVEAVPGRRLRAAPPANHVRRGALGYQVVVRV